MRRSVVQPIFLSIVIPVYNESRRLHHLNQVAVFLAQLPFTTELLVVNDGSHDDTLIQLKHFRRQFKFRLISYQSHRGKGYALRQGMTRAKGKWHLFMDVDLSVPLTTIQRLAKILDRAKADIVIGSRRSRRSKIIRHQPQWREKLGEVFTKLSQSWLNLAINDFTCGFKCFAAPASKKLFSLSKLDRWGVDAEVLFLAGKHQFKVHEMPVRWRNDARTKVKFPEDIVHSLRELWLIRWREWLGHYH